MKILIVDAHPPSAQYLCQGLCQDGFNVDVVHDGLQGRNLALSRAYSLLVLDLDLPGQSGRAVLQTLLQAGDLQGALHAARMRPDSEILDALDLHYRLHWIVRQAQVQQQPAPAGLNADVLMERHHALNWLVLFEGNDWDDVDTPT